MVCRHVTTLTKAWLPIGNGILKLHPHCEVCGNVKNVSSDKGKKTGFFANVLARIRRDLKKKGCKISDAQIRLILMELDRLDFGDTFSITYSAQNEVFAEVVSKYTGLEERM